MESTRKHRREVSAYPASCCIRQAFDEHERRIANEAVQPFDGGLMLVHS